MFVIANKLRTTRHHLLSWSRAGIGNLASRISIAHSLLNDIQSALISDRDFAQEAAVRNQLEDVLEQEEVYWAQRAKTKFLALGNKNTSYFHRMSKVKGQGSCIKGIYNDQGLWVDKEDEIHRIFLAHFSSAYQVPNSSVNVENWDGRDYFDKRLSSDHQDWLNRPFRAHKVCKAIFQIGDSKAPGPNGFSGCFFQKYWDIVGTSITFAVISFLNSGHMLKQINYTYIALIPKIPSPASPADFRPISLCNVLYKIISKTLANRIKSILPAYISQS